MTKGLREAVIEQGVVGFTSMMGMATSFKALTDVDLAGCIQTTEETLQAAKQEQARRLSILFLPHDGEVAQNIVPRRSGDGRETAPALADALKLVMAMDDVTLAIYIHGTDKMLAAAKQEQAYRRSKRQTI
jgi:hypothetical protein